MKIIDTDSLPQNFPTHRHSAEFWEHLGRTVATFGFLEEALKKAILAFENKGTPFPSDYDVNTNELPDEWKQALIQFKKTILESATDTLGPLKDTYKKSSKNYYKTKEEQQLITDICDRLEKVKELRNPLCHGSWQTPDVNGKSQPLFIMKKDHAVFDTPVDVAFLKQTQKATSELACDIISSVTGVGLVYPGL